MTNLGTQQLCSGDASYYVSLCIHFYALYKKTALFSSTTIIQVFSGKPKRVGQTTKQTDQTRTHTSSHIIYRLNFTLVLNVTTSNISIRLFHSGFLIHKSKSCARTALCLREVTGDSGWVCANTAWATQENMTGIHTGINTAAYISIKSPRVWILLLKTHSLLQIII